jgi:predicted membrane-bound mannosyltransferase
MHTSDGSLLQRKRNLNKPWLVVHIVIPFPSMVPAGFSNSADLLTVVPPP